MTPLTRFIIRVGFVALVAASASLQGSLPGLTWEEGLQALTAALVAAGAYSGVGAATTLEPSVGKKTDG